MIERSPLWPPAPPPSLSRSVAERDVQLVVDDHEPLRRDLVERGQRGHRLAGQVHVGPRPGQGDRDLGQPSLGDVVARPVRLEARTGPLGQQGGHHVPDVVPVARVLRPRVAQAGDDPAFSGQPACSSSLRRSPASPVSASASGASGAPSAASSSSGSSAACCAMTASTSVSGSTCRVTPAGSLRSPGVHRLAELHALDVDVDALRDVRRVGFHRDLHQQLIEDHLARGDLAGHPDRHLDRDLLTAPDQDQVHVLEEAPDRVPLHRLGQGKLAAALEAFQEQQHVRRLQREHQGVPGQAQVAGVGPVPVQHGGHLALAAGAAGSALAELGASLGGDLNLGHGAFSSSLNVRCGYEV